MNNVDPGVVIIVAAFGILYLSIVALFYRTEIWKFIDSIEIFYWTVCRMINSMFRPIPKLKLSFVIPKGEKGILAAHQARLMIK